MNSADSLKQENHKMKLCLLTNGDCANSKLWSGTPAKMKQAFSVCPAVSVDSLNYHLARIWGSIFARLFHHYEFVIGGSRDPWSYHLSRVKSSTLLKKHAGADFYLFICDYNIPKKKIGREYYALYTDNTVFQYFNYLSGTPFWRKWYESFNKKRDLESLQAADLIFTQNEWVRQCYINELNLPAEKIHNVGFGVNLKAYHGEKDYSREELLIVLRRGTEHYKGLYLLLDAFEILKKTRPQAKLSVVGTTARTIEGVTYYEGFPREKTVELFQQATLYVMPALREPNGITYLEGLANKAPIVGLNRFALPEFSGNGKWGFMAEHEDPQELAQVLDKALDDKERLREMGLAGQLFMTERYNWQKVCEEMKTHMEVSIRDNSKKS